MTESKEGREILEQGGLRARREVLLETIREALAAGDDGTLQLVLNDEHAADLAELMGVLEGESGRRCMGLLGQGLAARVMAELDPVTAAQVTADLGERVLSGLVGEMPPDAAADVLADLPEGRSQGVLSLLPPGDAAELQDLMEHPEDTGGGIMTSRLVAVPREVTVSRAVDLLRAWAEEEEILTVFVVDQDHRLVGTVSLRRMLLADRGGDDGGTGRPGADHGCGRTWTRRKIAAIFADYDLLALPVVDEYDELIGQVTVDDIVDIIHEEATEDNLKMAATSSREMEDPSALGVVRRRLPWLMLCLAGTLLTGGVLDLFSGVLAALSPLVLFVPAIMAMGGNSGIQTSTVTVRALATGALHRGRVGPTLWRELRAAAGIGLLLGDRRLHGGAPVDGRLTGSFLRRLRHVRRGPAVGRDRRGHPPLLPGHGDRSRRRFRPSDHDSQRHPVPGHLFRRGGAAAALDRLGSIHRNPSGGPTGSVAPWRVSPASRNLRKSAGWNSLVVLHSQGAPAG